MNTYAKILYKISVHRIQQYANRTHDQVEFIPEMQDCWKLSKTNLIYSNRIKYKSHMIMPIDVEKYDKFSANYEQKETLST